MDLDSEGGTHFGKLTEQVFNEHSRLAIVLDGDVQSAPSVNDGPIYNGSAVITGHFTEQEARNLASVLQNPLQTPVAIEEERHTSATLGSDSIRSGIYAGIGRPGCWCCFSWWFTTALPGWWRSSAWW